jgi:hypothetical protein
VESERENMTMTIIPDKRDAGADTMTAQDAPVEPSTVIDFKDTPMSGQRLATRRWRLIGGVVGGSIALATAATVLANAIAKRPAEPRRRFGARPVRRFGVRHVAAPRGGSAWLAYTYRLPDLRVRLPEMALPKLTLPKAARQRR